MPIMIPCILLFINTPRKNEFSERLTELNRFYLVFLLVGFIAFPASIVYNEEMEKDL